MKPVRCGGNSRLEAVAAHPLSPSFFDTRSQVEAFASAPPQIDVARPVEWIYPLAQPQTPAASSFERGSRTAEMDELHGLPALCCAGGSHGCVIR